MTSSLSSDPLAPTLLTRTSSVLLIPSRAKPFTNSLLTDKNALATLVLLLQLLLLLLLLRLQRRKPLRKLPKNNNPRRKKLPSPRSLNPKKKWTWAISSVDTLIIELYNPSLSLHTLQLISLLLIILYPNHQFFS